MPPTYKPPSKLPHNTETTESQKQTMSEQQKHGITRRLIASHKKTEEDQQDQDIDEEG